jgi:SAM-dependent methyltransferase
MSSALQLYGLALAQAARPDPDSRRAPEPLVRFEDGALLPLPVDRYVGAADTVDETLLDGIVGPVLDVGCGPGRHLRALTHRGVFALGVDLSPIAVDLARSGGARAIVGDVFDELPGVGTWRTALLLDGNVGIGGRPQRLLRRLGTLLHADGRALVELEAPGVQTFETRIRIETDREASEWLPWARVSVSGIDQIAADSGMTVRRLWPCGRRWFALLQPLTRS